ncbi:MAG: hypothetical protein ACRC68_13645 [Clostridium sp.]
MYKTIFKSDTSTKTAMKNGFSNVLFDHTLGQVADTYEVVLTNETLLFEAIDHKLFKDEPDFLSTITIPIKEIIRFDIVNNSANTKGKIELETSNNKIFNFYYPLVKDELDIPRKMKLTLNI